MQLIIWEMMLSCVKKIVKPVAIRDIESSNEFVMLLHWVYRLNKSVFCNLIIIETNIFLHNKSKR